MVSNHTPTDKPAETMDWSCRVLLVDDQAIVATSVKILLRDAPDMVLRHCPDPRQALAEAHDFQPTVLLLDIQMPHLDGFALLPLWQADPHTGQIPVVMLSVEEQAEMKARAFDLGAHDYLIKLPRREELVARLRHHSRGCRLRLQRDVAWRELHRAEAALRQQQAGLEQQVAERTAELAAAHARLAAHNAALSESEERLRSILHNMPVLLFALDEAGRLSVWNRECERITGYGATEMIGRTDGMARLFPDAAYRQQALSAWTSAGVEEREQEWQVTCRNGELRTVAVFNLAARFPIPGWAAWRVGVDLSDRLRLERRLRQAQKLEAIGTLAGGVAHDFNNILGVIIGYGELAMDDVPAGSQLHHNLEEVFKAGMRAKELVSQLLTFSRQSRPEPKPLDLGKVVEEGVRFLRATLSPRLTIEVEIAPDLGAVMADATQLHQVLLNLGANAAQAIGNREDGRIGIALTRTTLERQEAAAYGVDPGRYGLLELQDNGAGIPAKFLDRIFDPFFTTKEVGEGTGLGLSLVHGIVVGHGGGIAVTSREGRGSQFHIVLPLLEEAPQLEELALAREGYPMGEGRLLVVDDEEAMLQLMDHWLRKLGYQVTAISNPLEALARFRQTPDEFAAVITDYLMPHLKGGELARRMLDVRADLPILLCTASIEIIQNANQLRAWGFRGTLQKPFQARALAEALRDTLSESSVTLTKARGTMG